MAYIGILCINNSPMIEIPAAQKPSAAYGCWMAAALYAVTFVIAYGYKLKASSEVSAREPIMTQMTDVRNRE